MAISNHASEAEQAAETERVWAEHWIPIVTNPDGSLNLDQIKRELHDAQMYYDHCTRIYDHVTNGRVSKPNTLPSVVIAIHDDLRTKEIDEAREEGRQEAFDEEDSRHDNLD